MTASLPAGIAKGAMHLRALEGGIRDQNPPDHPFPRRRRLEVVISGLAPSRSPMAENGDTRSHKRLSPAFWDGDIVELENAYQYRMHCEWQT